MNTLAIDYGTQRIGLAISINNIISPLATVPNNDEFIKHLRSLIDEYQISKIFVGLSEGKMKQLTNEFVQVLRSMIELNIETVEESVSTIEADEIYKKNRSKKKEYKQKIDSIAAAVILRRVLS